MRSISTAPPAPRRSDLRAGYFLHWHIIRWLRDNTQARWYDLGGTDGFQGLHQFKKGMVGERGVIRPVPPVANYAAALVAAPPRRRAFAARELAPHCARVVDRLRADRAKPDQKRDGGRAADEPARRLLSQSSVIFAARLFGAGVIFLAQAAIARFWGAEVLGEYLLVIAAVNIVAVVMPLGFETIGTYFAAEYRAKGEGAPAARLHAAGLWPHRRAAVLLLVAGYPLAALLGEPGKVLAAHWLPAWLMPSPPPWSTATARCWSG